MVNTEKPNELALKQEDGYLSLDYGNNFASHDPEMDSSYLNMTKLSEAQFAKLISGMGAQPGKPTDQGYIFVATEGGSVYCIARYDLSDPALAGYAVTVPNSDIKE